MKGNFEGYIVGHRKASREGAIHNPRGFARRASVTNLPCRFRRAQIRGFQAKGKTITGFVSVL
jgi:hypothetical protein